MTIASEAYNLNEIVLDVSGVSAVLGGKQILRDLNMQVRNITRPGKTTGQVVTLLGPSGMGKTTLFRILAGLAPPDSGSVLIGDPPVPVERGMVGVVFQHYILFDHRTILGNLTVAAKGSGLSGTEAKKASLAILDRFGMSELSSRYPAELSGGQRQRVAIAQQFLCSRHFLLMDEPFSGLDPIAVDNVCALITEVASMHDLNTIIIVTHNIEAGCEVADTVLLMGRDRDSSGKVIPGARIMEKFDLIERGLAWRPGIDTTPEFLSLTQEIRSRFRSL